MINFVFINSEKDFEYAQKGSKAILGKEFCNKKGIKSAKDYGLSVWLEISRVRKISVCSLTAFAGRAEKEKGTIYAITGNSFEKIIHAHEDGLKYIDGFILPMPKICGVLWNKSIERVIDNAGEIYEIFDEEIEESHIRSLYYESIDNILFSKYIRPICKIAKSLGKNVCFVMNGEIQYDFMPFINPIRLCCEDIAVAFEGVSLEINALRCIKSEDVKEVLLIKPVRGTRMKYVHINTKPRVRLENPALCASFEGTYFCDRLNALGKRFEAVDEYTLEKYAHLENGKIKLFSQYYNQVIICDSCRFSEKGVKLATDARNLGVSINSAELIEELLSENLEEK